MVGNHAASMDFNPLSPHGERPSLTKDERAQLIFQSTLPAWGETGGGVCRRPPAAVFQSTLPAWGETQSDIETYVATLISIHSPRMGRDPPGGDPAEDTRNFNPLSPHGERHGPPVPLGPGDEFQSTLPAWGETRIHVRPLLEDVISIHSPRMGRDQSRQDALPGPIISIHSPRMGRDADHHPDHRTERFQSTLPAWGETRPILRRPFFARYFNPLSPHGERPTSSSLTISFT